MARGYQTDPELVAEIARYAHGGLTPAQIADEVPEVPVPTIYAILRKVLLCNRNGDELSREAQIDILEAVRNGTDGAEITEKWNVAPTIVDLLCRRADIDIRRARPSSDSETKVDIAINLYRDRGLRVHAACMRAGISPATLYKALEERGIPLRRGKQVVNA